MCRNSAVSIWIKPRHIGLGPGSYHAVGVVGVLLVGFRAGRFIMAAISVGEDPEEPTGVDAGELFGGVTPI